MRAISAIVLVALIFGHTVPAVAQTPSGPASRVSISVVDKDTGKPVTKFSYRYAIVTADGEGDLAITDWEGLMADDGVLVLQAPKSCLMSFYVRSHGYEGDDSGSFHRLVLKSTNNARKLVVKLQRGIKVSGRVFEALSKKPVMGARVMPQVRNRGYGPDHMDENRAVVTDAQGKFTLEGVSQDGICIRAAGFQTKWLDLREWIEKVGRLDRVEEAVALEPNKGEVTLGKVVSSDGNSLEAVRVFCNYGRDTHEVRTDRNGRFALNRRPVVEKPDDWIEFSKPGYVTKRMSINRGVSGILTVTLAPIAELRGRVLKPDGAPVDSCTLQIGREPAFSLRECTKLVGRQGNFAFLPKESGKYWILVRADGHADWEGTAPIGAENEPLTIRLGHGVPVKGTSVAQSGSARPARLTLRAVGGHQNSQHAREEVTIQAKVQPNGAFAFEQVRRGDYQLKAASQGFADHIQSVTVADKPVELGAIVLKPAGRLIGHVHSLPTFQLGSEAFFHGEIYRLPMGHNPMSLNRERIDFITDENGRFELDLPGSDYDVRLPYMNYDMRLSFSRDARIVPGKTTQASFFDPLHDKDMLIDFTVGNGSKKDIGIGAGSSAERKVQNVTTRRPAFYVELTPVADGALSSPGPDFFELPEKGPARMVISDVQPGKYRLRIKDVPGIKDVLPGDLFNQMVNIGPSAGVIRVSLASGAVTGQVERMGETGNLSTTYVYARSHDGKVLRTTRADSNGNFCLRYLPDGPYSLVAWDRFAGWCKLGKVEVRHNNTDVGSHQRQKGGTIQGSILAPADWDLDRYMVIASDETGIEIEARPGKFGVDFKHIWPGKWTLRLVSRVNSSEDVLATTTVELKGTEEVKCKLMPPKSTTKSAQPW